MADIETVLARYMFLKSEIKKGREYMKSLNAEQKKIEEYIQEGMRANGVGQVCSRDGGIIIKAKETTTKRSATKAEIAETLAEQTGMDAQQVVEAIEQMSTRTKKVKLTLVSGGAVVKQEPMA